MIRLCQPESQPYSFVVSSTHPAALTFETVPRWSTDTCFVYRSSHWKKQCTPILESSSLLASLQVFNNPAPRGPSAGVVPRTQRPCEEPWLVWIGTFDNCARKEWRLVSLPLATKIPDSIRYFPLRCGRLFVLSSQVRQDVSIPGGHKLWSSAVSVWREVAGFTQGSQERLIPLSQKSFVPRRCSKACDLHRGLSEAARFVSRLAPWPWRESVSNIMKGCAVRCGSFSVAINFYRSSREIKFIIQTLSGGQVARTLHSQCKGPGFDPWWGN